MHCAYTQSQCCACRCVQNTINHAGGASDTHAVVPLLSLRASLARLGEYDERQPEGLHAREGLAEVDGEVVLHLPQHEACARERVGRILRPHLEVFARSFLRERAGVAPKPEVPRGVARIPLLRLAVNERHAVRVHLDITLLVVLQPVDPAHAQAVLPVDEELVARAEARRALGHVTLWVRALIHRLHLGGAALERRRVAVCSILAAARLACQEEVVAGAGEQPLAPDDDAFQELVLGEVGRLRQQLRAVGEPDDGRIVARLVLLRLAVAHMDRVAHMGLVSLFVGARLGGIGPRRRRVANGARPVGPGS
mmetsp:Transcript_30867/g.75939  ORF Transcript_30867/g.75939 Transcript_30867/m.75939 type:complete len:310 (-) Transcript_30867:123-1052(-)